MKQNRTICRCRCDLIGSQSPPRGQRRAIVIFAILGFLFLAGWPDGALADVSIHPTTLYLSKTNPGGRFTVSNSGIESKVIDVSLSFGYPVSDNDGNISFLFLDSASQTEPSMQSWATVYPCHFELAPGEFQVVAVAAEPPENLPDREYWLRPELSVRSVDLGTHADESPNQSTVNTTELHRYVLGVNYRQGVVRTGISICDISATVRDKRLRVLVDLQREGNAAYRGNIVCSLWDAGGNCIADLKRGVAVYHSMKYRFEFNIGDGDLEISDGLYTARVELNTDRPGDVLQSPPVEKTITLTIKDGLIFDNQSVENNRVKTTAPEREPFLRQAKQDMPGSQHQMGENTVASKYPRPVRAVQEKDQYDALVESHLKARVLEKRLKEINREQDMILRELHELTVIIQ